MNEYGYFIIFVYFKSIISGQDWNIAGIARFLLPAKARIATFAQIRSVFLKGVKRTNGVYVNSWPNSLQPSEPSVWRGRAQAPEELYLLLFLSKFLSR